MLHLTTTFLGHGQKTATTLCNKKVAVSKIAIDSDADCEGCRKIVDEQHSSLIAISDHCAAVLGENSKSIINLRECISRGPQYRSFKFL